MHAAMQMNNNRFQLIVFSCPCPVHSHSLRFETFVHSIRMTVFALPSPTVQAHMTKTLDPLEVGIVTSQLNATFPL